MYQASAAGFRSAFRQVQTGLAPRGGKARAVIDRPIADISGRCPPVIVSSPLLDGCVS
jgi:hypothetical protein